MLYFNVNLQSNSDHFCSKKMFLTLYFDFQIMLNSFTELLLPDNRTNSFLFDSDLNKTKPFGQDSFELGRGSEGKVFSDINKYKYEIAAVSLILFY